MANGNVRIDVDTSGAQKNVQALIDRFNGMTRPLTTASNAVAGYVDDMKKAGQSLTTVSRKQVEMASALGKVNTASQAPRQSLSELKRTLESVTVAYNSLTSQEKASPFGQALKGSITQLTDRTKTLQNDLRGVSDSLKGTNQQGKESASIFDKLESKLGMSIKSFLSLSTVTAAAGAALNVAKDAFLQTEGGIDEWGRTVEGAKGAYDSFLDTLNGGNWQNFFSNLSDAITGARDLYDALDRLGSIKANNSSAIAILQQEIQQLRVLQQKTGKDYSKQILAKEAELKQLQGQEVGQGKKAGAMSVAETIQRTYKAQQGAASGGLTQSSLNWAVSHILGTNKTGPKGQAFFDQQAAIYNNLRKKGMRTVTNTYTSSTGATYSTTSREFDITKLTRQQQVQYRLAKAITDSETQIQKGTAIYAQAVQQGASNAREEFKTNRYAGLGSGRGGGSGSGNTTTKTGPVFTEDAQTTQQMSENVSVLESKLKTLTKGSEEYVKTLRKLVYWKKEYNRSEINDKGYTDFYSGKGTYGLKGISIMDTYGKTSEPNEDFKISEDKLPDLSKLERIDLSQFANSGTNTADAWQAAASAISSAGSAMQGLGNTGMNIAGIIAQAIANIAMGMASMLASPASTGGGPWTWVAAAASGVATMVSTIAAIHSATGYAEGGVVGGNSYSGDKLWARLNSGEVVVPSNLAEKANAMLDNSAGNASRSTIRGEQIVSVLRAYTRRTGRSLGEQL